MKNGALWLDPHLGAANAHPIARFVLAEIVAADFVSHAPGTGAVERGSVSVKALFTWCRACLADARWTMDEIIVARDTVVVRGHGRGRYVGGWHNIPASGQQVTETGITIFRVADGKIRETWFEVSDLHVAS